MKKRNIYGLIIIFILVIASGFGYYFVTKSNPKPVTNKKNPKSKLGYVVNINRQINITLPEYLFQIHGRKKGHFYHANKIRIFNTEGKPALIQEITFNTTTTTDPKTLGFEIEDMNFDGYRDIRIQQAIPTTFSTPYQYWLWDPQVSQYVPDEQLTKIPCPQFDRQNKVIKSFRRISAATTFEDIYQYQKGIPTLIKETQTVTDMTKGIQSVTITELKGKKMKVTKKINQKINDEVF